MEIEKNIPIPDYAIEWSKVSRRVCTGRKPKYHFKDMEISDSWKICDGYSPRERITVLNAANAFIKNNRLEWQFIADKCPNDFHDLTKGYHTRIWRLR